MSEKYFLKYLSRSFSTVEGAHDILKYLSGKYLLSAASNGPQFEQDNRLKNAGIYDYFQSVFTSEAVGYPKPKKEFFMICLEKMGNLLPSETIMVGDSLNADIVGGMGFTAIMVSWLAKFNPLVMIFVSGLIVFLQQGAAEIVTQFTAFQLNESISDIITGIILFFIIGSEFFVRYKINRRKVKED